MCAKDKFQVAKTFSTSVPAAMWLAVRLIQQNPAFVCAVSSQTFVHTHSWDMHNSKWTHWST